MIDAALFSSSPLGPLYITVDRFDANRGEEWLQYLSCMERNNIQEVVSLDGGLCPPMIRELRDNDWQHIVNENFMLNYFIHLDYLLERVGEWKTKNLLCVYRNPETEPIFPTVPIRFHPLGYDLVDVSGTSSPIASIGFPDVYSNDELNQYGLFNSIQRAREVRLALYAKYGGAHHTQTHLWAIGRAA
jgi:hypothetical protein